MNVDLDDIKTINAGATAFIGTLIDQQYVVAEEEYEYSIDDFAMLQGESLELYNLLRSKIVALDSSVKEEVLKKYIAFKSKTNFVDIVPQKQRLKLHINATIAELQDPKGLCKDMTGIGHYGNGDVEVVFENPDQLEDVMALIGQALSKQFSV